jgi:phage terminase large subunit
MSKLSKNLVFLNENVPKYRIIGLQGGTRSGKTYSAVQWAIRFCHKYSGVTISICRDTFNALKATTMRDFFDLLNEAGVYNQKNYNATDHIYFLNGNYIEFFGLDSPGKVQGRKRDILIVDEAIEADWDVITQLKIRTTSRIIYCFNPSLIEHPIYQDLERNDSVRFVTTYLDNIENLNKDTIEEIERLKEFDPELWRVYGEGQPARARDAVYVHSTIKPYEIPSEYCYGLDIGWQHPMSLVEVGRIESGQQWHEIVYASEITTSDLIRMIDGKVDKKVKIHVDSARPDAIEELKRAGYHAVMADKSVKAGINVVKSRGLSITSTSLNLQREIKSYRYNPNQPDEVIKLNDDGMDAGRHGSVGLFGRPKQVAANISTPGKR